MIQKYTKGNMPPITLNLQILETSMHTAYI